MSKNVIEEVESLRRAIAELERKVSRLYSQVYTMRRRVFGPKMHNSRLVTVRIDEDTLDKIDNLVEKGVFKDRSTAFMIAVYEFLSKEAAAMGLSLAEFLEMAGRRV